MNGNLMSRNKTATPIYLIQKYNPESRSYDILGYTTPDRISIYLNNQMRYYDDMPEYRVFIATLI